MTGVYLPSRSCHKIFPSRTRSADVRWLTVVTKTRLPTTTGEPRIFPPTLWLQSTCPVEGLKARRLPSKPPKKTRVRVTAGVPYPHPPTSYVQSTLPVRALTATILPEREIVYSRRPSVEGLE